MTMPVLHRAIAALAITMFVLSMIFVAREIAFTSPDSLPASAPRIAARNTAPLKTIAASAKPGHAVTKVIAKEGRPAMPAPPPKKRSL